MSKKREKIFILLGSNLGHRKNWLKKARQAIQTELGDIIRVSSIYRTEAWGVENQEDYFNQALEISSNYAPNILMDKALAIEEELGRVRKTANEARIIDIDILLWGKQIIKENNIIIPHPRLHLRNFALIPLMEIAGEQIHPVYQKTIQELYEICHDQNEVQLIDDKKDSL